MAVYYLLNTCKIVAIFVYFFMLKMRDKAGNLVKVTAVGLLFGIYWYWINQKLISETRHVFGLLGYFLLTCTATAYFPLPANLLVLGAVKSFDPLLIAVIGGFATLVAYFSEYIFFTVLFKFDKVANFKNTWFYQKVAPLFDKYKFFILSFASFLPIPSEPLRIYAITRKYPKFNYMSAGLIGRIPRYFLLGYYGKDYVNSIWFIMGVAVFPVVFLLIIRGIMSLINVIKMKIYVKTEQSAISIPIPVTSSSANLNNSDPKDSKS
ncbi:MAG: VTT domain-containing protein [bacterium]